MDGRRNGAVAARFFTPVQYKQDGDETRNAALLQRATVKAIRTSTDRDRLILEHHRLAYMAARKFSGRGVCYDDLVSEAMYGLCSAAEEYDPSKGKFSTYALWVCRRVLHDLIRAHRSTTGMAVGHQRRLPQLYGAMNSLEKEKMRPATVEEIAERTGWRSRRVLVLLEASRRQVMSLSAPISNDHQRGEIVDTVADHKVITPEHRFELKAQLATIQQVRQDMLAAVRGKSWSKKEQAIFIARYRLDEQGVHIRTMTHVGEVLNISESRVSQVLTRCWWSLKQHPGHDLMSHEWLKSLPHRVTMLADVFGVEAVSDVFGPRELWEVHVRQPGRDAMAGGRKATQSSELSTKEAALRDKLESNGNVDAHTVADVIKLLPKLSARNRQIMTTRFGFVTGDLAVMKNSATADELQMTPQQIGSGLFISFKIMHEHGLSKKVQVRSLNRAIDAVTAEWGSTHSATAKASRVSKPKVVSANGADLRSQLKAYVAARQLEEQVLRLWVVGSEDRFGPLEPDDIASQLSITSASVKVIIDRFRSMVNS